ncbi:MAG: YebC/PmpR family DNA-binding transcriptional regulator [Candidatus Yanofskybacteria bacterium]|nr:YebC/PmpR family DNA-binding transcriptional regulator [Candidatus Yanofskybacteria bacterium]
MSGHSKWSQIKHKKGISDQKKGQLFSKLAKKISIAAREGTDPSANYKLQSIIEEARTFNMPKENIERAIKRASEKDTTSLDEVIIQAIGPGSVAVIIEGITDNKNRIVNEIKHILAEHEAKMVPENSLNWMFNKNWEPNTPIEVTPEIQQKLDKLLEELDNNEDVENVYTNLK